MTTKKDHILIVDDDKDLSRSLAIILKLQGLDVTTVADGEAAIQTVKAGVFNLILIDIIMPGINGLETLKALKAVAPDARMVMMTGFAVAGMVSEAIKAGVDGVLYKPFNVDLIAKKLLTDDIILLFEGYLQTVWDRIVPVTGKLTGQLVFRQSLEKVVREGAATLAGVEINEKGFFFDGLRARIGTDPVEDMEKTLRPSLQILLGEVFDLLSMLTGDMLTSPLIDELSEELKSQKE